MMKKWIMVAAMALSMVVTAQQAQAENDKDFQPYLGVGISSFQFDIAQSAPGFNNPNVTGFVIKGGVDIYRYFGLEVRSFFTGSGTSSGTYLATPVTINMKINNGFAYFAKLQAPFENGFRIYGLAGGSQASLSSTFAVATTTITVGSNGNSGSYGGGIAYDADTGLSVELEWMRYASDVSAASFFASFRF